MSWYDDVEDLERMDGVRGASRQPSVGPWLQAVTGSAGWLLGGFRAMARREAAEATVQARAMSPAAPADGAPATLQELGVPQELARGMEVTLRAMGATAGGRVVGFTFRTAADIRHDLVLDAPDRAA